jgi:2-iminobutanoate/2-iminopropanoate deaminase
MVLASLGKGFADVAKANVYLIDMGEFPAMNEVYKQYFNAPYPARTAIAVQAPHTQDILPELT